MSTEVTKVALITGASRGIGAACAEGFAEAGHDVALVARRAETLTPVAERCRAHGARVLVLPVDVTEAEQVAARLGLRLDRRKPHPRLLMRTLGFA